ncbi:hypothetical protein YDYSG_03590 [Paenibacillus tyrfis]|nr:hypothetical protein YDYSG_03590 [Paenibacillus tyrfis]
MHFINKSNGLLGINSLFLLEYLVIEHGIDIIGNKISCQPLLIVLLLDFISFLQFIFNPWIIQKM